MGNLIFSSIEEWEIDVFAHVAKKMLAEHQKESPDAPAVGFTFGHGDKTVALHYLVKNGDEQVGVKYRANAVKTRYIEKLLESIKEVRREGLFL